MLSHKHRRFFAAAAKIKKRKIVEEENDDPYDVKYWAAKLGLSGDDSEKNSKKLRKELQEDGFEDDFLDLLDEIDDITREIGTGEIHTEENDPTEDVPITAASSQPGTLNFRGLVNRLSEGNIDGITRELSTALMSAESPVELATLLVECACAPTVSTLTLLGTYAACVCALSSLNGEAFGLAALVKSISVLKAENSMNSVKFISLLFSFGLLPESVMTHLLSFLVKSASIESLDLAVNAFRFSGKTWRVGHPQSFSAAIDAALSLEIQSCKRYEFIASELKLMKAGKSSFAVMNHFEQVTTWLNSSPLLQGRRINSVSLQLGSADPFVDGWVPGQGKLRKIQQGGDLVDLLEQKAVSLRMNTEIQKRLFVALMGAASVDDAVDRISCAVVKAKGWEDAASVLIDCAIREAKPNQFYTAVAAQVLKRYGSRFAQSFKKKMASQLIRTSEYPDSALSCLSALLVFAVNSKICDLGILRFSNYFKEKNDKREKIEKNLIAPTLRALPSVSLPQKYPELSSALASCL